MTGEQLGGTDLPIWYDVSRTTSGTNGIPNKGNVGRGTIYLKEKLSHSCKVGWLDSLYTQLSLLVQLMWVASVGYPIATSPVHHSSHNHS